MKKKVHKFRVYVEINLPVKCEVTDEEDRTAQFTVRLTKIDDALFMDFYPVHDRGSTPDFYDFHMIPVHSFASVVQLEPTLQLATFDHSWLENYLKENPATIKHEGEGKTFIVTASTDELRSFIGQHADTAFVAKPLTLERNDD